MARRRSLRSTALLGLVGALAGCSGGEAPPPDEADAAWSLSEAPALRIGRQEGEAAYLFQRIAAVRLLPDGGILVVDQGSSTLRLFAADGTFVDEWGGAGDGPGEFRYINGVEILQPDTVAVYDVDGLRWTLLGTDGTVLATHRLAPPSGGSPEMVLGRYADGGWAMAGIDQEGLDSNPADPDPDPMEMARFAPDGAFVETLGRGTGLIRMDTGSGGLGVLPFSPSFHGVLLRDSIFFTDGLEPVVRVLGGDGQPARTLEVSIPARDPGEARSALRARLEVQGAADRIAGMEEAAWDHPVPRIAELLAGEGDRLWLKHYEPTVDSWLAGSLGGGGGRWTVVEAEGGVAATLEMPDRFLPLEVSGGRVAGVHTDELGVQRVEVYRLDRGGAAGG